MRVLIPPDLVVSRIMQKSGTRSSVKAKCRFRSENAPDGVKTCEKMGLIFRPQGLPSVENTTADLRKRWWAVRVSNPGPWD